MSKKVFEIFAFKVSKFSSQSLTANFQNKQGYFSWILVAAVTLDNSLICAKDILDFYPMEKQLLTAITSQKRHKPFVFF